MHSIVASLLTIILALALLPAPQKQQKAAPQDEKAECGTTIPPEQFQAELARRSDAKTNARTKAEAMAALIPDQEDALYLPLTIHMVANSAGAGGLATPQQLDKVLADLNQKFRPLHLQFFVYGEIDYSIHSDEFFTVPNERERHHALLNVNVVPNTINVYFTNLRGIAGTATLSTNRTAQGILLDYATMNELELERFSVGLEVFAHEMGHFFDLYHTHESAFGLECPTRGAGSNCTTAGDLLCDTPADPDLRKLGLWRVDKNCVYDNSERAPATCDGTEPSYYTPLTNNLMSLSLAHCRTAFTPEQVEKMWTTLYTATNRTNLIYSGKFFVNQQASSSNNQCTIDRPCRTIAKAVAAARNGAIIFVKPGAHSVSTLSGKQVTIRKWGDGGAAVLRP